MQINIIYFYIISYRAVRQSFTNGIFFTTQNYRKITHRELFLSGSF